MATRSRIGLELSDGSILSAYHHWDGYPEWLGKKLEEHYNTYESVSELIDGGDMSVCWTKDRWTGKPIAPYVIENKEVEEYGPQYYSGRGEDCPPRLDPNLGAYADKERGEEYHYVFKKVPNELKILGEYTWVCIDMNEFNDNDPQVVDIPSD